MIGTAARAAAIKAMEAVPAVTATVAGGAGWAVANKTVAMIGVAVGADMTMMATVAVAGGVTTLEDRGVAATATATVPDKDAVATGRKALEKAAAASKISNKPTAVTARVVSRAGKRFKERSVAREAPEAWVRLISYCC